MQNMNTFSGTLELTAYKKPLPERTSLCLFNGNELIFSIYGKWLMPLFEAEKFLADYEAKHGKPENLCVHDTSAGKAAVLLMFRLGAKYVHADLMSELAVDFADCLNRKYPEKQMQVSFGKTVPRLLCQTETFFEKIEDEGFMYANLRQRAGLEDF